MIRNTRKECIKKLNNLQSNYATLQEQEKIRNSPVGKFNHQVQLLKRLDNGRVYNRLREIPIIHVAGTKERVLFSRFS